MPDFGQSKIGTAQIEWPAELAIGGRCAPLHLFQVEAEAPAQGSERLAGQVLIHQHARGDIEPTRPVELQERTAAVCGTRRYSRAHGALSFLGDPITGMEVGSAPPVPLTIRARTMSTVCRSKKTKKSPRRPAFLAEAWLTAQAYAAQ
jgi:hypothetical protein